MKNVLFKLCAWIFGTFNFIHVVMKSIDLNYADENFSSEICFYFFENNANGPAMDVQS